MRHRSEDPVRVHLQLTRARGGRGAGIAWVIAALALVACTGARAPESGIRERGQRLFNGYEKPEIECYTCHGGDASGAVKGPDLGKRVPKRSDAELRKAILEGPGLMPAFKGKLDDRELDEIVRWLRVRFPSE